MTQTTCAYFYNSPGIPQKEGNKELSKYDI
jgi:hypothetical protein